MNLKTMNLLLLASLALSIPMTAPALAESVATPIFDPRPGTFTSAQTLTLTSATPGATIRYTTNGADPTDLSTAYFRPIPVAATTTIKARAFNKGMTYSAIASGTFTIMTVATPTFAPPPGAYNSAQAVKLTSATPGAIIRYPTNEAEPTASSTAYSKPIPVAAKTIIRAKAFRSRSCTPVMETTCTTAC